jgi:hypothetical protein
MEEAEGIKQFGKCSLVSLAAMKKCRVLYRIRQK